MPKASLLTTVTLKNMFECMLSHFKRVRSDSFEPYGLSVACQGPRSMGILQAKTLEWVSIAVR